MIDKINWFKGGHTVRSTQTIGINKLIFKYGFKLYAVDREIEEVLTYIKKKFANTRITSDNFVTYEYIYDLLIKNS